MLQSSRSCAVVGLGYVGLPLAVALAEAGYLVYGINRGEEKVNKLLTGEAYIIDVDADAVATLIRSGRFLPTTDYSRILEVEAVCICVPTPLQKSKDPDVSCITSAMDRIIPYLHAGMLIVLESTTYPGTTEELVAERIAAADFVVGKDIYVAFSPERVDPGNVAYKTNNTPKIVGGITAKCTEKAVELYSAVTSSVITVSSSRTAEMAKLLENTFRNVNIALVNEMAILCNRMGIDIWEVIGAAASKPFGYMPFYPGPGIGGHCIPLDPMYLSWKAKTFDFYDRFIELATDINGNMPRYVVMRIADLLNNRKKCLNGASILLLGIAYKKNINDLRESPGLEIFYMLEEAGVSVCYHDEHIKSFNHRSGRKVESNPLTDELLTQADLTVLITDHDYFDYALIAEKSDLVFDTRNGFCNVHRDNIRRL